MSIYDFSLDLRMKEIVQLDVLPSVEKNSESHLGVKVNRYI